MGTFNQYIKKKMLRLIVYRTEYHRTKGLYKEIVERKKVWEKVVLTNEEIQEIKNIYGEKIDTRWHRYYQAFTGKFDAQYLPEPIFSPLMEKRLNPTEIALEMEDKIRIPILYGAIPDVYIPKTIVSNASGIYYDAGGAVISREEANALVKKYLTMNDDAVIKPTRYSYGGDGVILVTKESFQEIPYSPNFIVQERIVNQKDIQALNPTSLNTMRVITYICEDKYWCAPISLRMGTTSALTDNISGGGICIGVTDDGALCPYAYTENSEVVYSEHPLTKIKFEGYRIENIDKIITAAVECHKRTPHMRMVSWDMTLNEEGKATLIEVNLTGQSVCFPQYTHGKSLFGDNTLKMLELLK